jgi:transposase-like protein
LLRRHGLFSSYISKWRKQVASNDNKPTGRPKLSDLEKENRQLREENDRLKRTLERAELAAEVQKKLCELLVSCSTQISSDSSSSAPSRS